MTEDAVNYRRIPLEIFSEGKLDLIDELFAEDYVEHIPLPPGFPEGRASLHAFVPALRAAFPDYKMEVVLQYQDGDVHIGFVRSTGTMQGEFMGMPASGKLASWDEVHIGRFENGKVAEHWGIVDRMTMLEQLGFVPPPPGT